MSDFDKEAERQRLREKYERDEAKRRSTQRMSELLLKGATMTNKHCDECGDPIFRYDDKEFCPTCQAEGKTATSADQDAASAAEDVADDAAATGPADATTGAAADGTADTPSEQTRTEQADSSTPESSASDRRHPEPVPESEVQTSTAARQPNRVDAGDSPDAVAPDAAASSQSNRRTRARAPRDGDVAVARESLVRTLTWAANEAEATDDPRRASEFLAAAREAAEAIAALDR